MGTGAAVGRNVNVACTHAAGGFGDAEYAAIFETLVMPIARAFAPSVVVLAAGFDSARGDPIGGFDLTPEGYACMVRALLTLARGRLLVVPEGGYNAQSQAMAMDACLREQLARAASATEARPAGWDAGGDAGGDADEAADGSGDCGGMGAPKAELARTLAASLRHLAPHWPRALEGWEERRIGGERLGGVPVPACLECATHAPCWCGCGAPTLV